MVNDLERIWDEEVEVLYRHLPENTEKKLERRQNSRYSWPRFEPNT
jgi:hypothetical protein